MGYLVFDIETVPDNTLWKPTAPKTARSKKPADQVPPLYAHRPIAIGFALFTEDLVLQNVGCVQSDDEPGLITNFSEWVATLPATLVTFNGRGFDIPVLGLRALRHGLVQRYVTAAHRKRYSEEHHLDLFEALTEYGALGRSGFSLDTFSQVIGLPGKGEDNGAAVAGLYAKGEHAKINLYCRADVFRTSFLLFRYRLMRGQITVEQYRVAATALFDKCIEEKMMGLTFAVDKQRLLLETAVVSSPAA
jgi:predicted PolB exonuclease-like 3'-5' exonuclease